MRKRSSRRARSPRGFGLITGLLILLVAIAVMGLYLGGAYIFLGRLVKPPSAGGRISLGSLPVKEQLKRQGELKKFANNAALQSFLDDQRGSGLGSYYGYGGSMKMLAQPMALESIGEPLGLGGAPDQADGRGGGGGGPDYSPTNVQVAGVEESDLMLTDGNYIYAVADKQVVIVAAQPAAEAAVLSTLYFFTPPQGMYVSGDTLVVYGSSYGDVMMMDSELYTEPRLLPSPPFRQSTYLKVYDISDRRAPVLKRDLTVEGNFFNSRLVGDYVYFLTQNYEDGLDDVPVPQMMESGRLLPTTPGTARCNCPEVFYFDIPYQSIVMTSVAAVNIKDHAATPTSQVYLLGPGQNLYMSPTNLYVVYTKHVDESRLTYEVVREVVQPRLPEKQRQRMAAIEAASPDVLSDEEKIGKIMAIIENYASRLDEATRKQMESEVETRVKQKYQDLAAELEQTVVHRIGVAGSTLTYAASGQVPGNVLNQFSMDEQDGYFRLATTRSQTWSRFLSNEEREPSSNVYVLDQNLKVAGSLTGLAKGERIYSARFMGDRAYLVTFKQMDPLFAIDLSQPTAPKVLGELKIPGFSTYLHPYDENTIIGFGRATEALTDERVRQRGLKLSLFDVSDVTNLKEIDFEEFGAEGSSSPALDDHKAFLFSRSKNLLVIPARLTEQDYQTSFNGALVFTVTKDGITLKGKVSHHASEQPAGYDDWRVTIKRSRYIENDLYTLSDNYLNANDLNDLSLIKEISLGSARPTPQPPTGIPLPNPLLPDLPEPIE